MTKLRTFDSDYLGSIKVLHFKYAKSVINTVLCMI